MPWTEQLPSGKWRACWRNELGKQRSRSGFGQKAAAMRYAGEQEGKTRRGDAAYSGRGMTWAVWSERWLDVRRVAPSTKLTDQQRIDRYLMPQWGRARIDRISRETVQRWVNDLEDQGLSPATVNRIERLFSASMKAAVVAGAATFNPCYGVKLPTPGKTAERFLSRGEFDRIIYHLDEPYRTTAIILAGTGMRLGEVAGLHWDAVDLENRTVTVATTFVPETGEIKGYPKSKKPRVVPLADWAVPRAPPTPRPSAEDRAMPTTDDLDAIRLAAAFYRFRGAREQAIRDRFGISPTRFWQRVTGRLLHDPVIEAALPVEVHALRRLLAAQLARRAA